MARLRRSKAQVHLCVFFPFWIKVGFNVDLKCTRMTNCERVEVLMREYLNKSSSNQLFSKISNNKSQDEMLLSGDWTDSALREATVDIEKSTTREQFWCFCFRHLDHFLGSLDGKICREVKDWRTISARFCLNT